MHRPLALASVILLLLSTTALADFGTFADKVAGKVESAATKAEGGIERAGSRVQSGASRMGDKMDTALKPVRDKLAQNEYLLSRRSKLHTEPSAEAESTATFEAGTKVVVDDWSDDGLWGHVRVRRDGKVHQGWMVKENLSKTD